MGEVASLAEALERRHRGLPLDGMGASVLAGVVGVFPLAVFPGVLLPLLLDAEDRPRDLGGCLPFVDVDVGERLRGDPVQHDGRLPDRDGVSLVGRLRAAENPCAEDPARTSAQRSSSASRIIALRFLAP